MSPALVAVRRRMAVAWALALVLGAGAYALAAHAARTLPRPAPFGELAYYPSGRWLEPVAVGHTETAADLAWLRAVQYYGEHRTTDNRFERMGHVFDILTTLAPGFRSAYVFGAFALAQEGQRFPEAERLMLRGLEHNPRDGELAFEAGFLYFVRPGGRDLPRAAECFEAAARLPGAPASARRFAAYTRQNSGGLAMAYELWRGVLESSPNPYMRERAEKEMARIREAMATGRAETARDHITTPLVIVRTAS